MLKISASSLNRTFWGHPVKRFCILSSSFMATILVSLPHIKVSMFTNQPQFIVKAEANKAFDKFCLIGTFSTGDIADCLQHCLQDCRCQSFQICQNTKCHLCSSHKEENSSLLHERNGCTYAMYEGRPWKQTLQVKSMLL